MSRQIYETLIQLNKLIEKTPQVTLDKIILIGGQALILWADIFNIDTLTAEAIANLASDDMDFMGSQIAVSECAKHWKGKAIFPSKDDATPNSGQVVLAEQNDQGEFIVVDFLGKTYGIATSEVENYSDTVGNNEGHLYRVISPPLCLLSRIKNLTGYLRGEPEQIRAREASRVRSAIAITRQYLIYQANADLQEGNTTLRTRSVVNYLIKHVLNDADAINVSSQYQIDFTDIFPAIIASVCKKTYDQNITRKLARFKSKVEKKTRAKQIRIKQKQQREARLTQLRESV
jgi:hypothetical protein